MVLPQVKALNSLEDTPTSVTLGNFTSNQADGEIDYPSLFLSFLNEIQLQPDLKGDLFRSREEEAGG